MRWLRKRIRDDRGATAVFVGILMIPLLGFAAISVDVGALYSEKAQLQNGADAAALAIAQECAKGKNCNSVSARALAATFANGNSNDGVSNVLTPTLTANTVLVTTSTREGGADALSHPFAQFIGIDSSTVRARAVAEWKALGTAKVLPLAISLCDFNAANATSGKVVLIRYDENKPCKGTVGAPIPGGFGWLDRGGKAECRVTVSAGTTVLSEAGNSYPNACDSTFADIDGEIVIIPVYNGANPATGPNKSFTLAGLAAFEIVGWKFAGGNSEPRVNAPPSDSGVQPCTGNCRGIQGSFVEYVCLAADCIGYGGPSFGATAVRLID